MRRFKCNKKRQLPAYLDGTFSIYEIAEDQDGDYQKPILRKIKSGISFSDLQIFDKAKIEYKTAGINVVRKIRTRPIRLSEKYYIGIGEKIYKIENSVTAINSNGFEETDITLSSFTESYELEV